MVLIQSDRPGYNSDYGAVVGFNDLPDMYMPEERPLSFYQTNRAAESIDSNALSAAITAIGATPTRLLVDKDLELTNSSVIQNPKHIVLTPINGARIKVISGKGIEFQGIGVESFRREQVFDIYEPRELTWTGAYPSEIYPEWFGVVSGDSSAGVRTANSAAMKTLFEAFVTNYKGGKIVFSSAKYYFEQGFAPNMTVTLEGSEGTELHFGINQPFCIRPQHEYTVSSILTPLDDAPVQLAGSSVAASTSQTVTITLPSALDNKYIGGSFYLVGGTLTEGFGGSITNITGGGLTVTANVKTKTINGGSPLSAASGATFKADVWRNAAKTVIKNLTIYGGGFGASTHVVNITGLTMTRVSGAPFVAKNGYMDGETFTTTDNNFTYVLGGFTNSDTLTIRPIRMHGTRIGVGVYRIDEHFGTPPVAFIGATIFINGTSTTINDVAGNTITTDDDVDWTGWIEITALASVTNVPVRFNLYHGIDAQCMFYLENVKVLNCAGYAYHFNSAADAITTAPGTGPNQNNSYAAFCFAGACSGGLMTRGINSNAIEFHKFDFWNNKIAIYDEAQHANLHVKFHTNYNVHGIVMGFIGIQGAGITSPYTEGFEVWNCSQKVMIDGTGGSYPNGLTGATELHNESALASLPGLKTDALTAKNTFYELFGKYVKNEVPLAFGIGALGHKQLMGRFGELLTTDSNIFNKYYNILRRTAGLYEFIYYDGNSNTVGILSNPDNPAALAFTTSDHSAGGGRLVAGNGLILKDAGTRPAASAGVRGMMWIEEGAGGAADTVAVCLKSAADAYSWVTIATG